MPSFGDLIASSMPDDGLQLRRDSSSIDLEFDHSTTAVPIVTPALSRLAATTTKKTQRPYSLPPAPRSLRRSSRAHPPRNRVTSRQRESTLQKKPLPSLPVADITDESDDSSLPELSCSINGTPSRRSSGDSFSYLDRARLEIDLLLGTLKSLPVDEDTDMYGNGGVECLQLPGMWREDQYAPVTNIEACNPLHALTRQSNNSKTADVATRRPRSSSSDDNTPSMPLQQDHDKIVLHEAQLSSTTLKQQSTSLVARWRQSGCYVDNLSAVHELATDQHQARRSVSTTSLQGSAKHVVSAAHSRLGSTSSTRSDFFVSPISSDVPASTCGKLALNRLSDLVELPASNPTSATIQPVNQSMESASKTSVFELPANSAAKNDLSLEAIIRRNNSVASDCSSSLQRYSSVYESRRVSQPLLQVPKPIQTGRIVSSYSETSLSIQTSRPWKGKGKLPPIRTISWEAIPQADVGVFCNAFNKPAANPRLPSKQCPSTDVAVPNKIASQSLATTQTPRHQQPTPQPVIDVALRKRIESMNKRVSENESRLQEEFDAMTAQFKRESDEVHQLLLKQQEEEAMAAAEAAVQLHEALEMQNREAELARARALLKAECIVCGDEKDLDGFPSSPPTSKCQHDCKICIECLDSWVASTLKENGTDNIKCPECPEKLQYSDVQLAASPVTFEAYDKAATLFALSSLPEFAWCLAPKCGYGQLNVANNNYMECLSCGYKQCLKHHEAWHRGETCEQYDARTAGQKAKDEAKTIAMLDAVSKTCPGEDCGWRIQKGDGCDHITCRKCKHEFCWQCLASHKEIKRIGNTAHSTTCKFHSDNLELTWPFNRH